MGQPLRKRGFTLIEVAIAAAVLTLVSISLISSYIYSSRATRLNTNFILAKNLAHSYFEKMMIDKFADVNPSNYPNVDRAASTSNTVYIDQALGIKASVTFVFKGFGRASGGGGSSLTQSDQTWVANEWKNNTLYIVDGLGRGAYRTIAGNSANSLTLGGAAIPSLNGTTRYMINNGKTIEITITWDYMKRAYSSSTRSLVVNRYNDPNLGNW
ncbi:MAG: prepilin-type N-terminal cleavage/methylation domain-containing protein [Candidatus Sumerlaeota bacterium]|nr:prepilin-type N-terminal cleavage/methylation domain-containing protein [Candidatus Sumerlaeota bacterium]